MVRLYDKQTGRLIGAVGDADLKVLVDQLEEEHSQDTDYYISADTIDLLESNGASAALLEILRRALGNAEGVDISWQRE